MTKTQADIVIETLNENGASIKHLQSIGIKNPSSVVCKLRAAGVPIMTHTNPFDDSQFYYLQRRVRVLKRGAKIVGVIFMDREEKKLKRLGLAVVIVLVAILCGLYVLQNLA